MKKRTIRASEIGTYLYCKRAWWYQIQGVESQNQQEMAGGFAYHQRHGKQVLRAVLWRAAGGFFLLAAIAVLAVWLTQSALR